MFKRVILIECEFCPESFQTITADESMANTIAEEQGWTVQLGQGNAHASHICPAYAKE